MASQWVDVHGRPWRFSTMAQSWQRLADNTWTNATPPSGGLSRPGGSVETSNVLVVETVGPPGPEGPSGPPGSGLTVAELLSGEYQDGVNNTFPLSVRADLSQAFQVFRNGLLEVQGHGYLVTPTHVTFTTPPLDDDVLSIIYQKAQ